VLILLPPSETKRVGGVPGTKLDLSLLRFPQLKQLRATMVSAVRELARDTDATVSALKLGPTQRGEVAHNRAVTTSATMPAVDRYTGVVFDALDASSLPDQSRAYLDDHLVIHSAILGPVGALDPIPAYRLSHDSRVPGIRLKRHWAPTVSSVLTAHPGLILDARSEGYAALGPLHDATRSVFLRVVTTGDDGRRRALNHFNKHAKGALVRELALSQAQIESTGDVIQWGARHGFHFANGVGVGPGGIPEIELVI